MAASADLQRVFGEALSHHQAGRLAQAEKIYRDILVADPDHADGLHLLGVIAFQNGRHREALGYMERAIALTADHPVAEFHNNIAKALRAAGEIGRAVDHLETVVRLKPADPVAYFHLGIAAMESGASDRAANAFAQTAALKPDFAEAHGNWGAALRQAGKLPEAERVLRKALTLQPREASIHYNLGMVLKDQGRVKDAVESFKMAATVSPQHAGAQWNQALGNLLLGDFAEGWKTFDWYTKIPGAETRSFAQPAWDGGDLTGKTLLLYEEHGYGDTLQFVRYARELKKRASRVVVLCRPEMARLLAGAPGVDAVSSGNAPPPFDCHASFFALPKLMNTGAASIPADVPYLFAQDDLVAAWRGRDILKPGRNAGLVWRGNKKTDARRAMSVQQAMGLCAVPGINWVSLQVGADATEDAVLAASHVKSAGALLSDWADTAALISTLDLVVTVDTAVAHLAGALGKPVWIMLPFVPDWRWLLDRGDSPWYPTARLFRQPAANDWDAVIASVGAALKA